MVSQYLDYEYLKNLGKCQQQGTLNPQMFVWWTHIIFETICTRHLPSTASYLRIIKAEPTLTYSVVKLIKPHGIACTKASD